MIPCFPGAEGFPLRVFPARPCVSPLGEVLNVKLAGASRTTKKNNYTISVLHCYRVICTTTVPVKNVTVTLDEETAAWARVHAAERGMSVSRMLGEFLRQRMHQAREYDAAMRRFLAKPPKKLRQAGARYPSRDELHDRAHLRR